MEPDFIPDTSPDFIPESTGYSATNLPPGLRQAAPNLSGLPTLTSQGDAAKYSIGQALGGAYDVAKGALQSFAPPTNNTERLMLLLGPAGLPLKRMLQSTGDTLSQAKQVPGAIQDLMQSEYGLSSLAAVAPRAVGQGAATLALTKLQNRIANLGTPLDTETAAARLTNAVNPAAKKLAGFEKDLNKHFDKVTQYARDNNITINSRESLAKAMQGAADTQRAHWYDNILGPVKDATVDVTGIPGYSGGAQGTNATLGALDARLSQINAELSPKFAKGGIAGQAAVKSAPELNAEAGAIRSKLYGELATRTGLPVSDIAGTRGSFGALRDLSEKTGLAAAQARTRANIMDQGPTTLNPFSNTKHFLLDKAINAMRGDPAARMISQTINRAAISPFSPPQPIFTEKATIYRPPPVTQVGGTAVPSIFDRPEPTGVQGSPVRGPRPKPGANRVPVWKKMLAESLSEEK